MAIHGLVVWMLLASLPSATSDASIKTLTEAERTAWLRRLIPLPHEIAFSQTLEIPKADRHVRMRRGAGAIEQYAVRQLAAFGGTAGTEPAPADKGFELLVGLCDANGKLFDTVVPDAARLATLPNSQQAYLIRPIGKKKLVLTALDERGLCYACQTMGQLVPHHLHDKVTIPLVSVTDWPDIEERGLWGCKEFAVLNSPHMAKFKMNLVESHETI